ncbi:hypothetical protein B0H13DRAFT_1866329 [Mycena leptocephala]|nr:hypothetical protein B0H13DRAFT_1866329 [Mycena leptocephala]
MEATTDLGEAQNAWNNAQTDISMGVIEYKELDIRRAEEIELCKSTAIPRKMQNEVSQRRAVGMKEELTAARGDAKAEPSADTTVVDLEGKLKLGKAKSSSSGRVCAPTVGVGATTSNVTALGTTTASLTPASSELLASAATVAKGGSDVAGARCMPARKRAQADSSGMASVSSNKCQKKLEGPLVRWMMQDSDAGEKLIGHEWVKRFPEEFTQR